MEYYHVEFLNCPIFARSLQGSMVYSVICMQTAAASGLDGYPLGLKSFRTPVNRQDRDLWSRATIDLSWQAACLAIVSCILNELARKR